MGKPIYWSEAKSEQLRHRHGIGFEEIIIAMDQKKLIADRQHANSKYQHQRELIVEIETYAYVVPYVEDEASIFFKTLFPSRVATRQYLTKGDDYE
ncbi:MAG: hypothetical protein V3V09_07170 [Arenicellales bacterium]